MTELIINLFTDKLNLFGAIAGAMLIACIPMLMDTGGNAGGQSSATIIRGLSLGEIEFSDFFRVIGKELTVALMSGAVLAVINFVKMVLVNVVLYHYAGQDLAVYLIASITISLAILLTIVVAKFAGCTLPMLAKKIGFDPAVMAAPFITTMIDVTSLLLLFALANIILMHVR
ncbi:MAG: magnesium transporter, partial [Clostridia bacterium]|nr:magnesium transporter [Clostridia bacterium]